MQAEIGNVTTWRGKGGQEGDEGVVGGGWSGTSKFKSAITRR